MVPDSWKRVYNEPGNESYPTAHIIIHNDNNKGAVPYTKQYEGCGKGGDQAFFYSHYILKDDVFPELPYGESSPALLILIYILTV